MEQRQELRNDGFHRVGHEHLVAVELNLVLADFQLVLDLGEVEDTGQVEGVVHVQVDIEHRVVEGGVEAVVEVHVVLILEVGGLAGPERLGPVDDVVFVRVHVFAVFPFLFLAHRHGNRHELAVLVEQFADPALFAELLAVVVQLQGDDGAAVGLVAGFHLVLRIAAAFPFHCLGAFLPGKRLDGDLLGNHERGVESEAEVADDAGLVLVFFEELTGARECDLVDVLVDLLFGHADTAVDDFQNVFLGVHIHADGQVAQFALEFAARGQRLEFQRGVHGVRHQLTHENVVVRVEELLDDGENVFGGYTDCTFCHSIFCFTIILCRRLRQKRYHPHRCDKMSVPVPWRLTDWFSART